MRIIKTVMVEEKIEALGCDRCKKEAEQGREGGNILSGWLALRLYGVTDPETGNDLRLTFCSVKCCAQWLVEYEDREMVTENEAGNGN